VTGNYCVDSLSASPAGVAVLAVPLAGSEPQIGGRAFACLAALGDPAGVSEMVRIPEFEDACFGTFIRD
jgi:hypothetical protein